MKPRFDAPLDKITTVTIPPKRSPMIERIERARHARVAVTVEFLSLVLIIVALFAALSYFLP